MDPIVASALGRVVGGAVEKSFSSSRDSDRDSNTEWSEEVDHFGGFELVDPNSGETITILTEDQLSQISTFLDSADCSALMQYLYVARFGATDAREFLQVSQGFEHAFITRVHLYCEEQGYNWSGLAGDLWVLLLQYYDSIAPASSESAFVDSADKKRMTEYLGRAAKFAGMTKPASVSARDIVDIMGSSERIEHARNAVHDIRDACANHYAEVNLTHTLGYTNDGTRFERSILYVPRTLQRYGTEESVTDDFLTSPIGRPRCVVIGNPGVGKSTLVQHIVHELGSSDTGQNPAFAPLVVQCKDFANLDASTFILDSLTRFARDVLQLHFSPDTVSDVLTLGRSLVVFDGIDEIIDIGRRQQVVKAIEAFGIRYPLIPILVTGRRIGYNKAPFNRGEFSLLELEDFSDDQVVEYSQRWFAATEKPDDLREAFLRESESIRDIRVNPLMLSLLCTLYRVRGHIPRNRHEIYKACADLLYHRWDSMRQIDQPTDHKSHGTRLMQDLAYFFYRSQAAQSGVEEKQLRKLIAQFFTDTASVEQVEAERRASAFLNFCADRAWLLSSHGSNEKEERLFGFTHRTFMEYFAAEAIVRRTHRLEDIVGEVASAYDQNDSSVLADVIFQCADDKYERGAATIVAGLLTRARSSNIAKERRYLSLCLRMMNAAPLPPATTDAVFDAVFRHWNAWDVEDSEGSSISFFELSRDPRSRAIANLKSEIDNEKYANALALATRWARIYWKGYSSLFDQGWADAVYDLVGHLYGYIEEFSDFPLAAYAVDQNLCPVFTLPKEKISLNLLMLQCFGTVCAGPAIVDLERRIWAGDTPSWVVYDVSVVPGRLFKLSPLQIDALADVVMAVANSQRPIKSETLNSLENSRLICNFLLWIGCMIYERQSVVHPLMYLTDGAHGLAWFIQVAATRQHYAPRPGVQTPGNARALSSTEVRRYVQTLALPGWFEDWCLGRESLIWQPPHRQQTRSVR